MTYQQLLQTAVNAMHQHDFKASVAALNEARAAAETEGNCAQVIDACIRLSSAYLLADDLKNASDAIQQARELKKSAEDAQDAAILSNIASIAHNSNDPKTSEEALVECARIQRKLGSPLLASTLSLLAFQLYQQQRFQDSRKYAEECLSVGSPGDGLDRVLLCKLLEDSLPNDAEKDERVKIRQKLLNEKVLQLTNIAIPRPPISELPNWWGADLFTSFLSQAHNNQIASMVLLQEVNQYVRFIDARFRVSLEHLEIHIVTEAGKKSSEGRKFDELMASEDWLEAYFFMQAHSTWLAAVSLCVAAHITPTFILLRGCLENALYGYELAKESGLKSVWLQREDSEEKKAESKKKLRTTCNDAIQRLLDNGKPELSVACKSLYNGTIDDGAHPNVGAFKAVAEHFVGEGKQNFSVAVLKPDEVLPTFNACVVVASAVFDIYRELFPDCIA